MILLGIASGVHIPPTITISSSTNYNQNSGVLNAVINTTGNRPITSVEFQYSTSATFASGNSAWFAATVNTTITQGSTNTTRTYSATGLSNGTVYYVRARATNASGFVTTSTIGGSFTTYSERTATFNSSSTWTNPRPTSGTTGLAITTINNVLVVAGGGGGVDGNVSGAGAGGLSITVPAVSVGSSAVITIGAGGAGGATGANGSASSLAAVATISTTGGKFPTSSGFLDFKGGESGNAYLGGDSSFPRGGGGGGSTGAGPNAPSSGNDGANGGAGFFGWGLGGGGAGDLSNGGSNGTPAGNGTANKGNGAGGYVYATGYEVVYSGGSGYASFKYWGP